MKLSFGIEKNGDRYVGYCNELDVASSGETIPDTLRNIADATALYIETLQDDDMWPPFGVRIESLLKRLHGMPWTVELVEICTEIIELSQQQRALLAVEKEAESV